MFVLATAICVAVFVLLILKLPGSQQDIITSFRAALFFVGLLALQNYVLPDSFSLTRYESSSRLPATMKEALIDKGQSLSFNPSPLQRAWN